MQEIVSFKKSIILKTVAHEITSSSLKHDYTVDDAVVEGNFYLKGSYKITASSVLTEDFYYEIPFSIAVSDRIDSTSIELLIEEFTYNLDEDKLLINIKMKMNYEEKVLEKIDELINDFNQEDNSETNEIKEVVEEPIKEENINNILEEYKSTDGFVTYKVYIAKKDDNYETISNKYNIDINILKEYNKEEIVKESDKIIIPYTS